ncbi:type II toxin-antitoxin system HicA family toxin [Agrilactobacillus yilanensis]|uniref:Type II toxin-antitoxin system HicA family toxin n=1 Tax=Agrilactobacillus yilanensis TaxID=2485997 RepID=A0ABW4J3H0_9LACO|nr:type II toxin-antitoxin system HicA family toxin [Agrilactobacillus yilanensis]
MRITGDHRRFTNDNGKYVTVAYSKLKANIPPKTYSTILKQAGLK